MEKEKPYIDLSKSMEMAEVFRGNYDYYIPLTLKKRVDSLTINKRRFDRDYNWFIGDSNKKINDRLVFSQDYAYEDELFRVFFGFVKGGRKLSNLKERVKIPNNAPFEFCTVFFLNPFSTPVKRKGNWGRNTFKDDDFEIAAKILFKNCLSIKTIYNIIDDLELVKCEIDSPLNLCQDRITGKPVGPIKDLIVTD